MSDRTKPPVMSLFSGAGGLDLGAEDAGASVRVLVEPDANCVGTLRANRRYFPEAEILAKPLQDVTTDELLAIAGLRRGEAALLVGGPPCQPFSKSGYWLGERRLGMTDPRAALLDEYVRVLRQARPEGFILENVPSLTHPAHRAAFDATVEQLAGEGYAVTWWRLNAADYGVPQSRVRIFIAGLRGRTPPTKPVRTHRWSRKEIDDPAGLALMPAETAGRWLRGLRDADAEPGENPVGRWAEHLRAIPPGGNYKFHTSWAGHKRPTFVTETMFWTFLLKLSPLRPSWTIQASAGPWTGPFHWDSRRLRVPELAALQCFPADFVFEGSRRAVRRQIGNAVPSLLSSAVMSSVLGQILGRSAIPGQRLSFDLADEYLGTEDGPLAALRW